MTIVVAEAINRKGRVKIKIREERSEGRGFVKLPLSLVHQHSLGYRLSQRPPSAMIKTRMIDIIFATEDIDPNRTKEAREARRPPKLALAQIRREGDPSSRGQG